MKYRLIIFSILIFVILTTFVANGFNSENPQNRVHQHQTARQPDAGCSCDGTELCTHLPLVLIDTGGEEIPGEPIRNAAGEEIGTTVTDSGEEMITAQVSVISNELYNHHVSDSPDLESDALIRIRGNSSRYFDKKGYLLRLTDQNGKYHDEEMMGMDAHYEWALHGPYLDKSLIRNYMWYNIAGEIMEYAPNVRFCEVILNGEYQGLYVMTETITNGEDCRVNISEPVEETNQTGYVLRIDRGSNTPIKNIETFANYSYRNLQNVDIQYPRAGSLTPEMMEAIAADFSDFEKALYSYDYNSNTYGYESFIDVDSFVDYFIINEFTSNYDAGWLSTYIFRDIGGPYHMVIWDFNSACNNYHHDLLKEQYFEMQYGVWYYMLMKDESFVDRIIERYRELRETYLSEEYINGYIDEVTAYLGDAIERNFSVWGYTFSDEMVEPSERNPRNHAEAIQMIKDFVEQRGNWLDENIEILRQFSHESKNKKFNY